MRVVFVIASIKNGGAERVLSALANHMSQKNEVYIAVLEENFGLYKFSENITFYYMKIYGKSKILAKFKKIFALRNLFKELKPELIISFIDWTNVSCVIANTALKSKLIATEHHSNEYLKSAKFRAIRNFAYRFVDGLSVLSKSDFEYYDFVKNREILHNPMVFEATKSMQKENLILSVGRLEHVKGYDIYFKALNLLGSKILRDWEIIIAGSGKEEDRLRNLARELGLKVRFLGHIEDVVMLYAKAKIFVLSSRSEGLSNVLLEAGAFGCARVSSNTAGGVELIKHGINGLLFERENENELAERLRELLSDESLQKRLGESASEGIESFKSKTIMQKWDKFIQKILQK